MEANSAKALEDAFRESERRWRAEQQNPALRRERLKREFVREQFVLWGVIAGLVAVGVVLNGLLLGGWLGYLPFPAATYIWFTFVLAMLFLMVGLAVVVTLVRYRSYRLALHRTGPD
jgi:sterol desaturase/sphingolipid hydroxylase (fatty acid hydroxylase superfamily)